MDGSQSTVDASKKKGMSVLQRISNSFVTYTFYQKKAQKIDFLISTLFFVRYRGDLIKGVHFASQFLV